MARKMISIRLDADVLKHVKKQCGRREFTDYVESALIAKSKFKVKEINKQP